MRVVRHSLLLFPLLAHAGLAQAQDAAPPSAAAPDSAAPAPNIAGGGSEYEDAANEIVVTATRPRGAVETEVPPVAELNEADVQSLGASSIQDVLDALGPQTGSGRGRGSGAPVILLNGRRISSFRELRDLPPEAIARVQVFPEEVALQYGYRPDQRVVNFVLKDNFASANAELQASETGRGGRRTTQASGAFTSIGKNGRFNIAGRYEHYDPLLESQRGIIVGDEQFPFAVPGNVVGLNGGEIDPALSAMAGSTTTVAGVPGSTPTLDDFVGSAGVANRSDVTPYRSLQDETDVMRFNATWTRSLSKTTELTVNGSYELRDATALLGLANARFTLPASSPFSPFANDVIVARSFTGQRPLDRRYTTSTAQAGAAVNGLIGSNWRWSATADFSSVTSTSSVSRALDTSGLQAAVTAGTANPFATEFGASLYFAPRDESRSVLNTLNSSAVANGQLFRLPAGPIQATVRAGYARTTLDSRSLRGGIDTLGSLSRDDGDTSINLTLPIADRREDVLGFLGRLSLNGNIGYHRLSDFGGLLDYGAGITWSPTDRLTLTATYIADENAPGLGDLGNPLVVTPNVAVFDLTRGETVLASVTSGGNPTLRGETRRDMKFGVNWEPPIIDNLSVQLEYFRNRARDITSGFPLLTPAIEAAFPGRVTRDADGRLVALDTRSVNFSRSIGDRLRLGLNVSGNVGKPAPDGGRFGMLGGRPEGARGAGGGRREGGGGPRGAGAGGGGRGGGGGFGGPGGNGGGRWQLGLAYTYHIREQIEIAPGLPILDLLNGDTTGSGGGQARHEVELQGGVFHSGYGLRFNGTYRSGSRVNGATATGGSDLRFGSLATLDLRLFAELDQRKGLIAAAPWLKGTRISLAVDNVFDQIQDVRDAAGLVPLSYQPGYIDPLGRSFRIELRKRF